MCKNVRTYYNSISVSITVETYQNKKNKNIVKKLLDLFCSTVSEKTHPEGA